MLLQRAWQLQETLQAPQSPATQLALDMLRRDLAGEPCLEERQAWEREFFGPRVLRSSAYAINQVGKD
ncbi:hypothetical protein D3C72_2469350 [compost metagenome]